MTTLDRIKNSLIDRILVSRNEKLLEAIGEILDSTESEEVLELNSHQIEMLWMSEKDIAEGNLVSQEDLKSMDSKLMEE